MKERIVRAVAGGLVLTSLVLANYVSPQWLWLAAFVGFNLLQSSLTRFCPLEKILERLESKGRRNLTNDNR
jgi:Inner membrane protein YgaP-like, transmembrane domain